MGDGILATFKKPNDAIDAAVAMQQDFKAFSETMPKRAFAVRIGVHAGEAIHEGGDVFGTPVNLSARILSKANAGQIYTSASVVEYCEPLGTDFDLVGDFELKGFKSAQTLYKVRMPIPA